VNIQKTIKNLGITLKIIGLVLSLVDDPEIVYKERLLQLNFCKTTQSMTKNVLLMKAD
jgi:hypothetical protein